MKTFDAASFCMGLAAGVLVISMVWCFYMLCQPYLKALLSGAHIEFLHILGMRLRQTPVHLVIDAYITIRKRSLRIPIDKLEAHHLACRFEIRDCADLVSVAEKHLRAEMEQALAKETKG